MAKNFTPVEETLKLAELLGEKPEIDRKITYFKSILFAIDKKIKSIDTILENKDYKNDYEASNLEIEKIDAEADLFYKQQYFESWLKRSAEFEKKYEAVTVDCKNNFDAILTAANHLKSQGKNFRLVESMNKYDKELLDNKEKYENNPSEAQRLQNEYYLYLKQEVQNSAQYGVEGKKKRFDVPNR